MDRRACLLLLASALSCAGKERAPSRPGSTKTAASRPTAPAGPVATRNGTPKRKRVTMLLAGDPRREDIDEDEIFGPYVKRVVGSWLASQQRPGRTHQVLFERAGKVLVRQRDETPAACKARLFLLEVLLYSDEADRRSATAEAHGYGEDCCQRDCAARPQVGWELDLFTAMFNDDEAALRELVHPGHALSLSYCCASGGDANIKRRVPRNRLKLEHLDRISFDNVITIEPACTDLDCAEVLGRRVQRGDRCFACSRQVLSTSWLQKGRRAYLISIDQAYVD